jgi:hypothetical protein
MGDALFVAAPRAVWLACVAACCLTVACSAHVNDFSAEPRHICPGQRVEVKWSVSGSATLTATPAVSGIENGAVPDDGHAVIAPTAPTEVVLSVTRFLGSPTGATQKIEVKEPGAKPELLTASMGDPAASPGCDGGKAWATVHVKRFASDIKVATVSAHAGDPRTYDVEHEGVHGTIAPGTPSKAFEGKPIAGDWLLTARLEAGQVCHTPTIQNNVLIDVAAQCE